MKLGRSAQKPRESDRPAPRLGVRWIRGLIERAALASRWRKFHRVGDLELRLLSVLVDPARLSLDVGANIGVYSYALAKIGRVVAFEPIVALAASIGRALPEITCIPCALADTDGSVVLTIPFHLKRSKRFDQPSATIRQNSMPGWEVTVPVRRLDSFDYPDVGFIKIDVEGVERAFLEGARATIAKSRPVVVIELIEGLAPGCVQWAADYFAPMDYDGFCIRPEGLGSLDDTSINYVFAPKEAEMRARLGALLPLAA